MKMNVQSQTRDSTDVDTAANLQTQQSQEKHNYYDTKTENGGEWSQMDIDPEDEVTGAKLYTIHVGICLCIFLVGLVRYHCC